MIVVYIMLALFALGFLIEYWYVGVPLILLLIWVSFLAVKRDEKRKRESDCKTQQLSISDIDAMSGLDFEKYTAWLLLHNGYTEVSVTSSSGDFGADVLAVNRKGLKCCFQCKNYKKPVGVKAVQEVNTAKSHYDCSIAVVITNSTFTQAALKLANECGVFLLDRSEVIALIKGARSTIAKAEMETRKTLKKEQKKAKKSKKIKSDIAPLDELCMMDIVGDEQGE